MLNNFKRLEMVGFYQRFIRKISKHERGASLVEYVLLIALIAVIGIPAISKLGEEVNSSLDITAGCMSGGEEGGQCGANPNPPAVPPR